jgi:hypothetical protein
MRWYFIGNHCLEQNAEEALMKVKWKFLIKSLREQHFFDVILVSHILKNKCNMSKALKKKS